MQHNIVCKACGHHIGNCPRPWNEPCGFVTQDAIDMTPIPTGRVIALLLLLALALFIADTAFAQSGSPGGIGPDYCGNPWHGCPTNYQRAQREVEDDYQKGLVAISRCVKPEDCGGWICSYAGCTPPEPRK